MALTVSVSLCIDFNSHYHPFVHSLIRSVLFGYLENMLILHAQPAAHTIIVGHCAIVLVHTISLHQNIPATVLLMLVLQPSAGKIWTIIMNQGLPPPIPEAILSLEFFLMIILDAPCCFHPKKHAIYQLLIRCGLSYYVIFLFLIDSII